MSFKSRLRILFVIGTMSGGGAERQIIEILKRLDRSRFEPLLYLALRQGELLSEVPVDVPIFSYGSGRPETCLEWICKHTKLTPILRYIHLARVLHDHKIDVIYDRTYLATLDAAGGCLFRPTQRISCCVVDPQPELELHARRSVWLSWRFARRAYRSATIVLANSEGLRKRIIEYFRLSPSHVRVVYNLLTEVRGPECAASVLADIPGSVSETQRLAIDPRRFSSPVEPKPFIVVNAGRLHPQKGQRFLLEAIEELVHRRHRNVKLVILGKGESEVELRDYICSHQLESYVTLAGFVSEPRNVYRTANLFVLSSLFEGMPNALIEAVSVGLPALSTDCPSGPSEILENGRYGRLVPPGDSLAIADGIADAMDHWDEWQLRAFDARQRVEELFDPIMGMHKLETLLEDVAKRSAEPRERLS